MKYRRMIIGLGMILIFLLVGCNKQSEVIKPDSKKEIENNQIYLEDASEHEKIDYNKERLASRGMIVGDDKGNIYYRSEMDDWHLYKAKINGNEKIKICDDVADKINVLDDYIYYTNYNDNFKVYRIKVDGTGREKIIDSYCSELIVTDLDIYLSLRDEKNESTIYRANLDGSNLELLVENIELSAYYKGVIYGSDVEHLYSFDLRTKKKNMLVEEYTYYVSASDEGIYFLKPDTNEYVFMDKKGNVNLILQGLYDFYFKDKNRVYYTGYSADGKNSDCIYYTDLETGKQVLLYEFLNQCYDLDGNKIDLTKQDIRKGHVDDKYKNEDGEMNVMSDSPGILCVVDGNVFTRATFGENIKSRRTWECLLKISEDGRYEIFD